MKNIIIPADLAGGSIFDSNNVSIIASDIRLSLLCMFLGQVLLPGHFFFTLDGAWLYPRSSCQTNNFRSKNFSS